MSLELSLNKKVVIVFGVRELSYIYFKDHQADFVHRQDMDSDSTLLPFEDSSHDAGRKQQPQMLSTPPPFSGLNEYAITCIGTQFGKIPNAIPGNDRTLALVNWKPDRFLLENEKKIDEIIIHHLTDLDIRLGVKASGVGQEPLPAVLLATFHRHLNIYPLELFNPLAIETPVNNGSPTSFINTFDAVKTCSEVVEDDGSNKKREAPDKPSDSSGKKRRKGDQTQPLKPTGEPTRNGHDDEDEKGGDPPMGELRRKFSELASLCSPCPMISVPEAVSMGHKKKDSCQTPFANLSQNITHGTRCHDILRGGCKPKEEKAEGSSGQQDSRSHKYLVRCAKCKPITNESKALTTGEIHCSRLAEWTEHQARDPPDGHQSGGQCVRCCKDFSNRLELYTHIKSDQPCRPISTIDESTKLKGYAKGLFGYDGELPLRTPVDEVYGMVQAILADQKKKIARLTKENEKKHEENLELQGQNKLLNRQGREKDKEIQEKHTRIHNQDLNIRRQEKELRAAREKLALSNLNPTALPTPSVTSRGANSPTGAGDSPTFTPLAAEAQRLLPQPSRLAISSPLEDTLGILKNW